MLLNRLSFMQVEAVPDYRKQNTTLEGVAGEEMEPEGVPCVFYERLTPPVNLVKMRLVTYIEGERTA